MINAPIHTPLKICLRMIWEALEKNSPKGLLEQYVKFRELSVAYYSSTEYPKYESLPFEPNATFMLLYNELYYRHILEELKSEEEYVVGIQEYQDSFQNFVDLFNMLIDIGESDGKKKLHLPAEWVWDIINSFTNQYHEYHKLEDLPEQGERNKDVWNAKSVLKYLHFLSEQAGFRLDQPLNEEFLKLINVPMRSRDACFLAGFYSLCGLLRIHSSMGDYESGLAAARLIFVYMDRHSVHSITFKLDSYFYRGFCLFMLRRWKDAEKMLDYVYSVGSAQRWSQKNATSTEHGQKQVERSKCLLAILAACFNSRGKKHRGDEQDLEEEVQDLKDSLTTQEENFASFTQTFQKGVTFLSELQLKKQSECFVRLLNDIRNKQLKTLLDLYTTISLDKLRVHMNKTMDQSDLECALLHQKLQMEIENTMADSRSGELVEQNTLDFHVDREILHVAQIERKVDYTERFLREIGIMSDLTNKLRKM